jgi:hypothetical protein
MQSFALGSPSRSAACGLHNVTMRRRDVVLAAALARGQWLLLRGEMVRNGDQCSLRYGGDSAAGVVSEPVEGAEAAGATAAGNAVLGSLPSDTRMWPW